MKKRVLSLIFLLLVSVGLWFLLDNLQPKADWCFITIPEFVVAEQPFTITLAYTGIDQETRLGMDLHWANTSGETMDFLASGGSSREVAGSGREVFTFHVAENPDMGYVFAVIFLSPTGRWRDHTHQAMGHNIPVKSSVTQVQAPGYKAQKPLEVLVRKTSEPEVDNHTTGLSDTLNRYFLAALYLMVSLLIFFKKVRKFSKPESGYWLGLTLYFLLIFITTLVNLLPPAVDLMRRVFRENSLYYQRQVFQQLGIIAVFISLVLLGSWILARLKNQTRELKISVGSALFIACLYLLQFFSFHFSDLLFDLRWLNFQLWDLAQFSALSVVIWFVVVRRCK